MRIQITVEVEVERESGHFASRADLTDAILEAVESADPGSVDPGNGSEYSVTLWDVSAE